jgi:hypothetical protein
MGLFSGVFGGSKSKSKSTHEETTNIVNKSAIKLINKQLSSMVSNTIVDKAKQCSASINQLQNVKFKNMTFAGSWDVTVDQKQTAALTFDCVQANEVQNEAGAKMARTLMADLKSSTDNNVMSQLEQSAKNKSEAGAMSFGSGGASASTDVNSKKYFNIRNESTKHLENVISNSIEANFTDKSVSGCIAKIQSEQNASFENIKVGESSITAINQIQGADLMAKCVQDDKSTNKVVSDIMENLGITIVEDTKSDVTSETKSATDTSSKQTGVIGEVGKAVTGVLETVGDIASMFGMGVLGAMALPVSMACCVLCCCCIILLFVFFMSKTSSSTSSPQSLAEVNSSGYENYDY